MVIRTRLFAMSVAVAATVAGLAAPASAATPSVSVSTASSLHAGQKITVTASGLPAATDVQLSQCPRDPTGGDEPEFCTNRITLTTDAAGGIRTRWTLQDPVYFQFPFGDPSPSYCRADDCRMIVSVPDEFGQLTNYSSVPLTFTGSPATVSVDPDTGLIDGQLVQVTGSAEGSTGRYVRLLQQACFAIVQGSGCNGTIDLGTVRLTRYDTFAATVPVSRILSDGQDCADPLNLLGECGITAEVLDSHGQPDDTFGVARLGDPSAILEFATP
jgi:hypothetical protein